MSFNVVFLLNISIFLFIKEITLSYFFIYLYTFLSLYIHSMLSTLHGMLVHFITYVIAAIHSHSFTFFKKKKKKITKLVLYPEECRKPKVTAQCQVKSSGSYCHFSHIQVIYYKVKCNNVPPGRWC